MSVAAALKTKVMFSQNCRSGTSQETQLSLKTARCICATRNGPTPKNALPRVLPYVKRYECKYGNRPKKTDPSRSTFQGHSRSSNRHGSIGYTWHPTSAWFAVTVGLSRTVSQIKGDFYRNQRIFLPRVFNATQRGFSAEFVTPQDSKNYNNGTTRTRRSLICNRFGANTRLWRTKKRTDTGRQLLLPFA